VHNLQSLTPYIIQQLYHTNHVIPQTYINYSLAIACKHICRPFYKIMDSRNYIIHANDLRAGWQYSANIITVIQQVIWPAPVTARQERCRTRECRAGRARKRKIQSLDICQAAPARLPRCTRPAVKRLLIHRSSLLVR